MAIFLLSSLLNIIQLALAEKCIRPVILELLELLDGWWGCLFKKSSTVLPPSAMAETKEKGNRAERFLLETD